MDFSIILVLPFAALVAFATLVVAAIAGRPRPRLIWPFAFSAIAAASAFLRLPEMSALSFWLLAFAIMALWAAIGTLIGAMAAKMTIGAARVFRSR